MVFYTKCVYILLAVNLHQASGWSPFGSKSTDLIPDDKIDLNSMSPDDIKYYKYVMILYCRVLKSRFQYHKRPWQRTSIGKLENFSNEIQQGGNFADAYERLISICIEILKKHHTKLKIDHYPEQALYNRLLKWLRIRIVHESIGKESSSKIIGEINSLMVTPKATNYLDKIIPYEIIRMERFFSELNDEKFNKLKGWIDFNDDYENAIMFMSHLTNIVTINANEISNLNMECKKVEIYENIIQYADDFKFLETFHKIRYSMMRLVDWVINEKVTVDKESPFLKGTDADNVDLSKINEETSPMNYYKHATIIFVRAFEKKFLNGDHFQDDIHRKNLENYPIRYQPYRGLRFCTFLWTIATLPGAMNQHIKHLGNQNSSRDIVYFYRLVNWIREVLENPTKTYCENMIQYTAKIFYLIPSADHILSELAQVQYKEEILKKDFDKIATVNDLLTMGQQEDDAIFTMITYDESVESEILCKNQNTYRYLLDVIDEVEFEEQFKKNPQSVVDAIFKRLGHTNGNANVVEIRKSQVTSSTNIISETQEIPNDRISTLTVHNANHESSSNEQTHVAQYSLDVPPQKNSDNAFISLCKYVGSLVNSLADNTIVPIYTYLTNAEKRASTNAIKDDKKQIQ